MQLRHVFLFSLPPFALSLIKKKQGQPMFHSPTLSAMASILTGNGLSPTLCGWAMSLTQTVWAGAEQFRWQWYEVIRGLKNQKESQGFYRYKSAVVQYS